MKEFPIMGPLPIEFDEDTPMVELKVFKPPAMGATNVRGVPLLANVIKELKELEEFRACAERGSERTYLLKKFLDINVVNFHKGATPGPTGASFLRRQIRPVRKTK